MHAFIPPNYHNLTIEPQTQRHIYCTSTQICTLVAAGYEILTGDEKRRYERQYRSVLGLGDGRLWKDEEVERAVRNGSRCNKTICTRAQNANASGCCVVVLKCGKCFNILAPELFFFNFSTPCILNVNNTGTKYVRIMKKLHF